MLEILNRKIAGDKVRLYAYDGKMRLRVSGTFYNAPNTAESIASAHSMALTRFADGSLSVDMQTLINSDATERQIEHRYEEILNKMEDVLGIEEGNCSSSGWFVGHGDSAYDYLMSDEERKFILSAVVDMSAAENEPEYAKMLAKPMADITEDIFLRPDVFQTAPWYDDFLLYTRIGTCQPKAEHIEDVQKALKLMGYETHTVERKTGLYLVEGALNPEN